MNKATEIRIKALKLFSQFGYDKTTLGKIAEEAGIKPPSLYNHFNSKEQLFLETFEDAVGEHVNHVYMMIQKIENSKVEKKLYTIFKEAAMYYTDKEEKIMFINKALVFPPKELKDGLKVKFFHAEDQFTALLEPIFFEGIQNGEIREQSFQAMLTTFYCLLDGLFMHSVNGGRRSIEDKVNDVWNIFWSGIKN